MKNYKKIEELLEKIDIDLSLEGQEIADFDELRDYIQDQGGFDCEVIYYSTAMDYLGEHDPSLQFSMGIASDMGYECKNINSELLASLLMSDKVREEFEELENEITELLERGAK
jgi:hypothetical protein